MAASTTLATKKNKMRIRQAKPKPPRRPLVKVSAPPLNQPNEMLGYANKLTAAAAANPTAYGKAPNIADLTTAASALGTAITFATGGTDAARTTLLTSTIKVHDLIYAYGAWIQTGANQLSAPDSIAFITGAGFQTRKVPSRTPVTKLTLSNNGPRVVHFELPKLARGVLNFLGISTDGGKTYVDALETENLKGNLTGLTSGELVYVRARTFVRGGTYTPRETDTITVT
jgi:hypothetical protein